MRTADERDALTRRIEQLAAASVDEPEGEGAAVAALVGALRAEIGTVRAELGSLRQETGGVRSDLDGLGGRLTGSVAASRSETGTLVRRVAELFTRLDGVGGRVDDLRNGLPSLSRELREGLEQVPGRTITRFDELTAQLAETISSQVDGVGNDLHATLTAALDRESRNAASTQAAMEDVRGALESRLAVLEDTLDALSERIEALARDGASTTTERLTGLSRSVEELDRRIADEGRDSAELLVGRLRDVTETRLSELETTLFDRLSDVLRTRNDDLRRDVLSALQTARSDAEQDRQAVAELAVTVRSALDGFGSVLDRSLTSLGGSLSTALAAGGEQTRGELAEMAEQFGSIVNGMQADLLLRDEQAGDRVVAVQSAVEAKIEQVRAQVATAITVIRSDVATEVEALTPRVDELVVAGTAVSESLRSMRTDVVSTVEGLRDRLVSVNTDTTEVLRGAMTETRAEVAEITRALREDLLARIEEKYGVVAERLAELTGSVAGTASASQATGERLVALTGLGEKTRRSVVEIRTAVEQRVEELDLSLGGRVGELELQLTSRLAELGTEVGSGTSSTRQSAERIAALTALTERQREEIQEQLDVARDDAVQAAGDLRTELVSRTADQIAGLTERLAALDGSTAEFAERVGTLDGSVVRSTEVSEQSVAGTASVNAVMTDLQDTIDGFRAEWPTRTFEVVEGAKAVAEGVVRDIRSEVEAQLERVREELARAVSGVADASSGLSTGTDRLSQAGVVLVEYLEQRDRLLEAERDRVLDEVLEAFAAGLPGKDRAALSGRVSEAASRRRDARDAKRYRDAVGEPVAPVVDDLPEVVRALMPAEPEPVAPVPASPAETAPTPRAQAAKVPTGRAPAKKAPGTRAPAEKAPATRAPATRAPAKRAPARKAPAKRAPTSMPAGPTPAEPTPAEPTPAEPTPAGPSRARPSPAGATPRGESRGTSATRVKATPARVGVARPPAVRATPDRATRRTATPGTASGSRTGEPVMKVPASSGGKPFPAKPGVRPRPSDPARPPASARANPFVARPPAETAPVETPPAETPPAETPRSSTVPDRRARLEAMPEVPGPAVALDAAAPPPAPAPARPPVPGRPARQEPAETSWASRSAPGSDEDDDEEGKDVSLRSLFRRRRS